ncbi:MAG: DUF5666 domain-containing protein [Chloroflexota bacterium]
MTEPDQIEFHERVAASSGRSSARSLPVRAGIVAGAAALLVIGAVAAMGASPAPSATGGQANLLAAVAPETGTDLATPFANGFRGGFGRGGFHDITISAINGSNLSLETADGWSRTITVASSTTLSKAGETITLADLAVGDRIGFSQERQTDGSYSIVAIRVVLPTLGGEVTAVSGNTITVTGRDGTTGTIHVDGDTTYQVNGDAGALSDITVGSFVVAQGALRADGSLDADRVHSGMRGIRDGDHPGRGFHNRQGDPTATPTPSSTAS